MPRNATLPELPTMWDSTQVTIPAPPTRLPHSQSFGAAEALARFSSHHEGSGTKHPPLMAVGGASYHSIGRDHSNHTSPAPFAMPGTGVHPPNGWSTLSDAAVSHAPLYALQPPLPMGGGGSSMMEHVGLYCPPHGSMLGGRAMEAMDCDSSMLSHATPLKPMGGVDRGGAVVGSCGGSPYDV